MKIQKQLNGHDPENGIWGDCFRTCIAIILDMDANDVPHFNHGALPDSDARARMWLNDRGIRMMRIPLPGDVSLESVLFTASSWADGLPYMLSGRSQTPANHVVVCHFDQIVCDPSQNDAGIVGPMLYEDGQLFWWVEFLVRAP